MAKESELRCSCSWWPACASVPPALHARTRRAWPAVAVARKQGERSGGATWRNTRRRRRPLFFFFFFAPGGAFFGFRSGGERFIRGEERNGWRGKRGRFGGCRGELDRTPRERRRLGEAPERPRGAVCREASDPARPRPWALDRDGTPCGRSPDAALDLIEPKLILSPFQNVGYSCFFQVCV